MEKFPYCVYLVKCCGLVVYVGQGELSRSLHVKSGKSHNQNLNELIFRRQVLGEPDIQVEINTLISIYKSNARKRDVPFDLTYIQFETLVDSECYFCGDTGGNTLRKRGYNDYSYTGIDRIDNSVGYLPSNCISCCSWCNRAKNNGTLANFVDKCKKITSRIEMDEGYFNIGANRMCDLNKETK